MNVDPSYEPNTYHSLGTQTVSKQAKPYDEIEKGTVEPIWVHAPVTPFVVEAVPPYTPVDPLYVPSASKFVYVLLFISYKVAAPDE